MINLNCGKKLPQNPIIKILDRVLASSAEFKIKKVNDEMFRGASATEKEMPLLAQKGIKIVLSLKTLSEEELTKLSNEAQLNGIKFVNIPINPLRISTTFPMLVETLKSASKENPIFIYCTFGADRTGFATALGRYLKEKIPMDEAIEDMHKQGFKRIRFFHMESFLKKFAKKNPNINA